MMTYARARLWLGISTVGTFVVLASAALAGGWPQALLPNEPTGFVREWLRLLTVLGAYVIVSLPFDLLGGVVLPHRFGRTTPPLFTYLLRWVRGVAVQVAVMSLAGVVLIWAARTYDIEGAALTAAALMAVIAGFQRQLAQLVGGQAVTREGHDVLEAALRGERLEGLRIRVLTHRDEGFVGGITGLPGWETVVVPVRWLRELSPTELRAQLVRRAGVLQTGSRTRGLLIAIAWNAAGVVVSGLVTGADAVTAASLVTLMCGFVLWSFLGLLILPSLCRSAVIEADRFAKEHVAHPEGVAAVIQTLDRWQEDEPARPAWIEAIFHPVPAVQRRLATLTQTRTMATTSAVSPPFADGSFGAWHAARMALPLSWVCGGLLSRAVHCNAGRPDLWVLLPGD
ncbi:MAG: hypothetical protein IPM18_13615 [Phycisphaerales bacterium]|nr:hypothetical protein [Phycisphaerales bacterium]